MNTSLDQYNKLFEPIWKNYIEKYEYINFLIQADNKDEIERIKKSTFRGLSVGTEKFIQHLSKKLEITLKRRPRGRPRKADQ